MQPKHFPTRKLSLVFTELVPSTTLKAIGSLSSSAFKRSLYTLLARMNSVIATPPPHPHQLYNPRLSPSRSMLPSNASNNRKRKAEDNEPLDDRMSSSPTGSPRAACRPLPIQRQNKRAKSGIAGRPLTLPRLLETLDADSLRGLLRSICVRHPEIGHEVVNTAPRPSVAAALNVLKTYENTLQSSFPYGGDHTSDYSYNRVRQALVNLLDALADFTPHFLPPHETSAIQALNFLDGATEVIHRLPDWSSYQNNLHKQSAYEEISKAWALIVREAAKRAGGIQLQYGGWDQKLARHNQQAGGKLQEAVNEMTSNLGWMHNQPQHHTGLGDDIGSVREELLSGTYGNNLPVHVGPW